MNKKLHYALSDDSIITRPWYAKARMQSPRLLIARDIVPAANNAHTSRTSLRVNRLGEGVDLQPLLCQIRVLHKLQLHPDQMPLHAIQLLSDLCRRADHIIQVALLVLLVVLGVRGELVVVLEGEDVVIRVSVEERAE